MDINVAGISPMDRVTPVSRIGLYPSTPNSEVGKLKPKVEDSTQPGVKLSLSPEARQLSKADASVKGKSNQFGESKSDALEKDTELSKEDQEAIRKLETRDLHVRIHEQQHLAGAGAYAKGGASFSYQIGPDGKSYAIGGEVQLDVGPVPNNPEATIAKAQAIKTSALAPSDPSGADRAIAAAASQMEAEARMQLKKEAQSETKSQADPTTGADGTRCRPFQFKAYQKMMNGLAIGRHLNLHA